MDSSTCRKRERFVGTITAITQRKHWDAAEIIAQDRDKVMKLRQAFVDIARQPDDREDTPVSDDHDETMPLDTPRGSSVDAAHVGTAPAVAISSLGATTSVASTSSVGAASAPAHSAVRVDSQGYYSNVSRC